MGDHPLHHEVWDGLDVWVCKGRCCGTTVPPESPQLTLAFDAQPGPSRG